MHAMWRDGLRRRVGRGKYVVAEVALDALTPAMPQIATGQHPGHRISAAGACPARCEETIMASYGSGDLVWDTTEATAPRWVLLVDGPPGAARRRVDPQDPSTPKAATPGQLRELIRRALHEDTGHWPVSVTLTLVKYKQRFRFHVVTYEEGGGGGL
jgi:hypothetical protein